MSGTVRDAARYEVIKAGPRLRYFRARQSIAAESFASQVRLGLGRDPKCIPPMFLYDARGSALFEEICTLPEYYITRSEASILHGIRGELQQLVGRPGRLVELGSGSSAKTRLLLDALGGSIRYVPIDIAGALGPACEGLLADYPHLDVTGIVDTYEGGLEFLGEGQEGGSLVAFLGSSLGNFGQAEAAEFLGTVRRRLGPGDFMLLGLDLAKDAKTLEAAYDDSRGVTARFNLNLLCRMNRELGADFDVGAFGHRATYDEGRQRIAMYLRSKRRQRVEIPASGMAIQLGEGELIHTEYSHKYTIPQIRAMLGAAGFGVAKTWLDSRGYFALTLASAC